MENVFRVVDALVADHVIDTYAIGGAIGALFYVEPFQTSDIDVFIPVALESSGLVSLEPLYTHLKDLGYEAVGDGVEIEGWHVQFLPAANQLIAEAIDRANEFEVDGQKVRVMSSEYLIAIALQVGRPKDYAKVAMFEGLDVVDKKLLLDLIERYFLEVKWEKYQSLL